MILIMMGVSGSGKTTIGKKLAQKKSFIFEDGDDYHPERNKIKMASGVTLDDEDRWPWLEIMKNKITKWILEEINVVLACSALKKKYRDHLISGIKIGDRKSSNELYFIYLKGTKEVIQEQISSRTGHFFPSSLLDPQFNDLEEPNYPEKYLTIMIQDAEEMVDEIVRKLDL